MSKTSGNLQNELNSKEKEIQKLNQRIADLEAQLSKLRKEKDDAD
jgi:cell division protein FtsB